jgi:predicted ATPase
MIRGIELGNVRIFEGENWRFDLQPLTVFCGANSAGKSTLLKTLLVLSQSQNQKFAGRLCLAGPRVDFGEYRSFVSHEDISRKVFMSTTVDFTVSSSTIEFMQSRTRPSGRSKSAANDVARTAELRAAFTFSLPPGSRRVSRQTGMRLRGADARNAQADAVTASLESATFQVLFQKEQLLEWKVLRSEQENKTYGHYQIFLPTSYFRRVGGFSLMSVAETDDWVQGIATLDGLLPQSIIAKPKLRKGAKSDASRSEVDAEEFGGFPMPPFIMQALWALDEALEEVHYLGPLRAQAKRYYVANLGTDPGMDSSGEFLPYVLRDSSDQRVLNVPPGSHGKPVRQTLAEALDGWVAFLRTGDTSPQKQTSDEVVLNTTEQVLVQINVKSVSGAESHALADSGFGYSQVLPILVRGLLADQGSTFIVEQPELHLNPSLQVRLAEFFISMVRAGKQVLIETHSEHIVNAIRVLTAEDATGFMSERSRIYFIDTSGSKPALHELSVQKDGTVPEWPRYFFGEAVELTGRLLRAQKRFRSVGER